jgi:hypothetical protein
MMIDCYWPCEEHRIRIKQQEGGQGQNNAYELAVQRCRRRVSMARMSVVKYSRDNSKRHKQQPSGVKVLET